MDYIAGIQSKRIDAQRAHFPPTSAITESSQSEPEVAITGSLNASFSPLPTGDEAPEVDENLPLFSSANFSARERVLFATLMAAPHGTGGNGAPRNSDSQAHLPDSFYEMLMKAQVQITRMQILDDLWIKLTLAGHQAGRPEMYAKLVFQPTSPSLKESGKYTCCRSRKEDGKQK